MQPSPKASLGAVLVWTLALAGCGGASSSVTTEVPKLSFKSSALAGGAIPAQYTCDGADVAPPLEWGAVPAGTGELVLFILGATPQTSSKGFAVSVEWAVAGLSPSLRGLAAGRLPQGAHVGLVHHGKRRYSICPEKGATEQYQFELYGLPASAAVSSDFVGSQVLAALDVSNRSTPAIAHGVFDATYKRR